MKRAPSWLWLLLVLQVAIAATTYLVAKLALASFTGLEVMFLRFAAALPLFAGLLLALGRPFLPPRGEWLRLLGLGVVGMPLNQGFFLVGLAHSTPTHAGLLYGLSPLLIFVIYVLLGHERATRWKLGGLALALGGVAVVLGDQGSQGKTGVLLGDALIFLGVLSWALYSTFGRPSAVAFGGLRFTCWSAIAGSVLTLPFTPLAASVEHVQRAPAAAWAALAFLSVVTSFLSYLLWYYCLERMEASRVAVFGNLQPVVTAVLAWAVLGTPVTGLFALGAGLVVAGVYVTQRG